MSFDSSSTDQFVPGAAAISSESGSSSSSSCGSSSNSAMMPAAAAPAPSPEKDEDEKPHAGAGGLGSGGGGISISITDLRFLKRLGSGDIGSVYLAELKSGCGKGSAARMLAAKVMDKEELEARSKEGRARTEKEILEQLDHPFLPRLYAAVENERWSCLLTEFCPGGDLHILRQRQPAKRFAESAVRFYAAEVVVALEYMHMLGIVYRDLKPENVLVRSDGHIMLTDFDLSMKADDPSAATPHILSSINPLNSNSSTACIIPNCISPAATCFRPGGRQHRRHLRRRSAGYPSGMEFVAEPTELRSTSFVGTHEYLAPEIVSGDGHGPAVDWWTLGVLIFELLYGATPFKGADNEATMANIVARGLEFPEREEVVVSGAARELVAGLLVKDPVKRMGAATGAAAVKRHRFFGGVNWALIRCVNPPHVPPPYVVSGDVGELEDGGAAVDYY